MGISKLLLYEFSYYRMKLDIVQSEVSRELKLEDTQI